MISVHRNHPWGPRLKPFTTASALALLLAGCAVGPEYQTPDIELPESWPAHITLEQQARDDWHRWWQRFEDPALNRLVERASEDNLELAIQLARIREARAQLGFADAERFPTVGYQAEANRERTPGAALPIDVQPVQELLPIDVQSVQELLTSTNNQYSLAASLEYEIDLWGRLANQRAAAMAALQESLFARDAAELGVIGDVVTTYVSLKSAEAQQALMEETLAAYQETYRLQALRFEHGDISELELRQAEAEWRNLQAELPSLKQQVETLRGALGTLVGMSPDELLTTLDTGTSRLDDLAQPVGIPAVMPSAMLQRRPDIRSAEAALIAATAQIGVAEANRLPSLNLSSFLGTAAASTSDLFSDVARTWGVGASVMGPLFDFGRSQSGVESAEALAEQAEAQYRLTVLTAFNEVRDALYSYDFSERRLAAIDEQLEAVARTRELAVLMYDQGQVSQLERLDAERNLLSARLAQAGARREQLAATATLFKALGGGWQETPVY
ncbi:efflux transporter outer membrane subunit [Vreelandella aquamarina]|jgi:multidrug efflux system outer membrane protein|uniref:efflux transporter outer membrane subunit n=1 Tax=Halomonadaceae TaxID=28256 RepID=UPI001F15E390|nr:MULTISPECIES: efflux transporter outer membrane subunit [Halomonas]MCF2913256.1 efflux transporter outer membrane subunit [Halomonas sp. Cn5-12]|tara:strand:- start:2823 stop:4331 length:1509 start_codon:yes stop_codon:yes gene_type:complete